jgi:RNA polymerase sigma factor (sigma-70 family)
MPGLKMAENSKTGETEHLVAAIAGGDRAAFKALYTSLEGPLYRFIRLKLNDPHRSADIMHDVFLEVWRNAAAFRGQSNARTWIFAIAWRKVMDVFRQSSRITYQESLPEQIDETTDTERALAAAEDARAVRECLRGLSAEHRIAVELTFFEEMSYSDIAETLNVPAGTVKSRVFHAKQLLLRCLSAKGAARGDKT